MPPNPMQDLDNIPVLLKVHVFSFRWGWIGQRPLHHARIDKKNLCFNEFIFATIFQLESLLKTQALFFHWKLKWIQSAFLFLKQILY